jgi:hypothetical protein
MPASNVSFRRRGNDAKKPILKAPIAAQKNISQSDGSQPRKPERDQANAFKSTPTFVQSSKEPASSIVTPPNAFGKKRKTDKSVESQGQNDPRKKSMLEVMIANKQKSQVFGLNFLQDMKGEPTEITGAYDHKQERWIAQEQVQSNPEHSNGQPDYRQQATHRESWSRTNTGGGRDSDSVHWDTVTDE